MDAEIAGLMTGVVNRDPKALQTLYRRFSKAIYNAIFAIVKRKEDADEILCEVFFQAWEKAAAYDASKGALYTWLLTMARNRAIDRIRSKGYKASSNGNDLPDGMDSLTAVDAYDQLDGVVFAERAALVQTALGKISADHRRVLETAYFEGQSQSQIAEQLGLPLGTVKSRIRDGMKSLQVHLKGLI